MSKFLFLQPIIVVIAITTAIFSCSDIENKNKEFIIENDLNPGIHAAFYNGKGNKIALSATNGSLILADSNLTIISSVFGHIEGTNSCFFSLDDKYIITGGGDRIIKRWDANNLRLDKEFDFELNSYTTIAGLKTIVGVGERGGIIVIDAKTSESKKMNLEDYGAYHVYYVIADSIVVVSSGLNSYEVDITSMTILHKFSGHESQVFCVMPNNSLSKVVTASADSTVKIFNRFTAENLYTSAKLDGAVYVACFNNEDNVVAASTSSGTIYFMDTTLSEVKMKIKAFETRINTIHYSPCGTRILAGSEGGGAKIFSTITGELLYELDYSPLE